MTRGSCGAFIWLFFIVLLPNQFAKAQLTSNASIPSVTAAFRDGPIDIDGRVIETVWHSVTPAEPFVQREPVEGAPAEEPTEVRVLYDRSGLYVGAILYDSNAEAIGDQLVRRDEGGPYDYFELSLDTNNDRLTGYRFRVSAAGVQRDEYLYDDTEDDDAWDAVWESAVHRDSTGWSVELHIPLSQLRYVASENDQSWGVNFSRRRIFSNETTYFALESRIQHGTVSVFGRLDGLRFPKSARRIELQPYVLADASMAPAEVGDPFFDGSELGSRAGLDLRLGLGGNYTLDATINPDFGQVEVDPAVINLTAFETFFREKRPFFVEDAQIFDFNLAGRRNRLFYSRRIGREPQGSVPDDMDYESIPTQTTIIGAAKLTGRSPGGLSVGGLVALAAPEDGRGYSSSADQDLLFPVEPRSLYGVARVRQDFSDGASQFGAILTATNRDLPGNGALDFLPSNAYTYGVDFEHNWGGPRTRDWAITGHVAGSYVKGSAAAIQEIQTSSNHYFQRPDATRFSVDSSATSMIGREWELEVSRRSAKHWTGSVWVSEVSPGFEINDLGFSTFGERVTAGGRLTYQEITPGRLFRDYEISLFAVQDWRHELFDGPVSWGSLKRAYQGGVLSLNGELQFLNYWGLDLEIEYSPRAFSSTATRGGPIMVEPATVAYQIRGNTDRRKDLVLEPSFSFENRAEGAYEWQTNLEIGLRPSPGWQIQLEPSYSTELDPAQYIESVNDASYVPTYGQRHIFGNLKQQEFSVETRVDVAFSPTLTVQFYAQPLISAGSYLAYKQLARPRSFDFDVFETASHVVEGTEVNCVGGRTCVHDGERQIDFDGDGSVDFSFDNEDFSIRSLKLNAVLRWEYRPGSTLFLVWQHNRRNEENTGAFDLSGNLRSLFATEADNALILKLNYWFDL